MTVLPLSEVFGPTFQGEGPHTGRRVAFVRLGLCNLACDWCDTPYTWDTTRYDVATECPDTPIAQIHEQLAGIGCGTVVLSGGEPLIHHHHLRELMVPAWLWHVETNGTIPPPPWWSDVVQHTTLSPKISTTDPRKRRLKTKALEAWACHGDSHDVAWKFVVTHADQLDDVRAIASAHMIPSRHIWIMPEGTYTYPLIEHHRALADAILDAGYNTTTRLHTLLWGPTRGH